jgi:signal transduction histidine kinase
VLFSSKISNSILTYLENQRVSLEGLYSSFDIPEELLRDPSSWMDASEMENFLKLATNFYQAEKSTENLSELVGHECLNLHSWGVLDSVLRMMAKPQDIYLHPERFLSYFISPTPPILSLNPPPSENSEVEKASFEISVSSFDYPLITKYLQAALEALPTFFGRENAHVLWSGKIIDINWETKQDSLFETAELERNVNPDLVETLMHSLEKKQKELEIKNRELLEKNKLLEEAQKKLESQYKEKIYSEKLSTLSELASSIAHEINNPLAYVMSNMMRINDYFIRAQQLITILIGQDRLTPAVQEAMRRTDWSLVQKDFPEIVKEVHQGLQKVRDIVKDLSFITGKSSDEEKVNVDLNQVVNSAVKMVSHQVPVDVKIDSHLLLNQNIAVFPLRLEQALVNILNNAVQAIEGKGVVRVVTRPKGTRAEIEISDTGIGMSEEKLKSIFKPFYTTKQPGKGTGLGLSIAHSIIEMHSGDIKVKSEPGRGSTFSIDLPL